MFKPSNLRQASTDFTSVWPGKAPNWGRGVCGAVVDHKRTVRQCGQSETIKVLWINDQSVMEKILCKSSTDFR